MKKLLSFILAIVLILVLATASVVASNNHVSRQEFFYEMCKKLGLSEEFSLKTSFPDIDQIDNEKFGIITAGVNSDYILGRTSGILDPCAEVTLEDIQWFLSRVDLTPKTITKTRYVDVPYEVYKEVPVTEIVTVPAIEYVTVPSIKLVTVPAIQVVTVESIKTVTVPAIQTVTVESIKTVTVESIKTVTVPAVMCSDDSHIFQLGADGVYRCACGQIKNPVGTSTLAKVSGIDMLSIDSIVTEETGKLMKDGALFQKAALRLKVACNAKCYEQNGAADLVSIGFIDLFDKYDEKEVSIKYHTQKVGGKDVIDGIIVLVDK